MVNREKAKRLGIEIDVSKIANLISQVSALPSEDIPVVFRLGEQARSAGDISEVTISLPDGKHIRVSEIAEIQLRNAPRTIIRVDGQRSIEMKIQTDSEASEKSIRKRLESIRAASLKELGDEYQFTLE